MDGVDSRLAEVGAVLVDERPLRRAIKRHRRLRGLGLQVPHAECDLLPHAELARLVEDHQLHVDLAALPEPAVAFCGSRAGLEQRDEQAELAAWRAIFHARVHAAFDARLATGKLTPAVVRERIGRIGQTEFDEIRFVLRQADRLLPPVDETTTYIEFAALYLELAAFAPHALARTFPALDDAARALATIALDVDRDALLAAARPPGAPELPAAIAPPVEPPTARAAIATRRDPRARAAADRARRNGNLARAALLAARGDDAAASRRDLEQLVARLSRALGGAELASLVDALAPLAERARVGRSLHYTRGTRLLYDLQAACVIGEREAKVVDIFSWAASLGERPIVRPLPATREVRIAKRLHAALAKLADCGLVGAPREQLSEALHEVIRRAERNVRGALRPALEAALDGVGLAPTNLPERVAYRKLVDELLDQAVAIGRLSLGHLRDAISHNELKLPDLRARQLVDGDQLLRADRALARSLDGVYRRGEVYLRGLQKLSSVLFGTPVGRVLTLYALIPVLGAFVAVEGAQHIVGPLCHIAFGAELHIATRGAFVGVGVFLFLLLHAPPFRRGLLVGLHLAARALRLLLYDLPRAVWQLPFVRSFRDSRFARLVVVPALPAALVAAWLGWPVALAVFAVVELVVNSRIGRLVEETIADWIVRSGRHLARRIVPGIVKYVLELFAELIELLDRGIYRVDEWLRFKTGQSRVTLVVKGAVTPIWQLVTYFLRLYVNLFVEPVVNPIKHFPVVTVAAKVMVPFYSTLIRNIRHPLSRVVGRTLAGSAAAFTVFVIPGFAGFLVWELKENWKLYRASRPELVTPIAIGHHGESMIGLMKPAFHSGTIPKLYAKLRRAAWKGDERGVAKHREALHHVEEAIARFAERELVALLAEAAGLIDLAVLEVAIASNRVTIELGCASVSPERATIAFEEQSGWLVASLRQRGWIDGAGSSPAVSAADGRRGSIDGAGSSPAVSAAEGRRGSIDGDERRRVIENALVGFYKRAGVDLVREQLEQVLGRTPYDVCDEGLVMWPGGGYETEVIYDLRSRDLPVVVRGPRPAAPPPSLAGRHALFGREPLEWRAWISAWEHATPPRLAYGPELIGHM